MGFKSPYSITSFTAWGRNSLKPFTKLTLASKKKGISMDRGRQFANKVNTKFA